MIIEELTFFRFFAAAIVVIFHFGREATGFGGVLIAGPQMVTFFFVLSGFVMGINYFDKKISKRQYWWARIARIMPVYLLALTLMLLSLYVKGKQIDHVSLMLNLSLLQAWVSPYPLSINSPGWSLSVEAFFYLTFPSIIYAAKTRLLSGNKMLAISLSIWIVTQAITTITLSSGFYGGFKSISYDLIYYFPLTHFCSFALGVSGAMWIINNKYQVDNEGASLVLVGVISFLIVVLLNSQDQISGFLGLTIAFGSSFYAPVFLIFIVTIAICRTKTIKVFSTRPLVLLGQASYSLYILQAPIYQIFNKYISGLLGLPPFQNFMVFFLFLTIVSILSFLVFEKPVNKFLRYSLPVLVTKQLTISFTRTN